jgi:leucyl aminopeptidase
VQLRDYAFDRYKTKRKEDEERVDKLEINFACHNPAAAEKAWARTMAIGDGVLMAATSSTSRRTYSTRGSLPAARRP